MKKIKLFALTALFCAMGTNVFAQSSGTSATKLFTFDWTNDGAGTLEATITGFVSELDAEFKSAVAIPATVTDPVQKDGEGNFLKYDVIGIAKDAFANEPINTISFFAPAEGKKGIQTIGAGAFAGTNIATLDLSNTKITVVNNLFGTDIDADPAKDKVNSKLQSLTLPATWMLIVGNAFENCTALATVNFGTATASSQSIGFTAFAGCPITALDFTGTKVTYVPWDLLYDGGKFKGNASLKTVTLTADFTALNAAFSNCTALTTVANLEKATSFTNLSWGEFKGDAALTTINTTKVESFNDSSFDGCEALTTVSLKAATYVGDRAFAASGLTAVEFPAKGLLKIGAQAFFECGSLATATLGVDGTTKVSKVTYIDDEAFAYTAITSFTIPEKNDMYIGSKAFAGTPITSFTWKQTSYDGSAQEIYDDGSDIFHKCSNVTFNTTDGFILGWKANTVTGDAPKNSKFSTEPTDDSKPFTLTAYSNNPNKFYVKWYSGKDIAIKKGEGKVYSGFLEGDNSLGMIQHKADADGYIQIEAGEAVIIITDNSELKYIPGSGYSTSWTGYSDPYTASEVLTWGNALKYCTAATTRGTLEGQLTDDDYYIYGWVNGSKGTGFQKITSGTKIPENTLFAFAKEPVAGARLTVKWYDEDGNLEGETTAIDAIENVAAEAEGETYNLAGQKVNAAYKGVIVKNGKKLIRK